MQEGGEGERKGERNTDCMLKKHLRKYLGYDLMPQMYLIFLEKNVLDNLKINLAFFFVIWSWPMYVLTKVHSYKEVTAILLT